MLLLLLGATPLVLGLPWTKIFKTGNAIAFSYGIGCFLELALFHAAASLFGYLHVRFHVLITAYSILLVTVCLVSLFYSFRTGIMKQCAANKLIGQLCWHEWILLTAFVIFFAVQVYHGLTMDLTYMSYDDAYYTAMATDTISADRIGMTNPYTGVASTLNIQRLIQTSLYFPAYLTVVSGVSVAVTEHTVQYIQFLFLAYAICIYASAELFSKRDNRLIFLVFVSVFNIFGYHSHYSLTFRLLGPNYQGKAVLAVSLTPLILVLLIHALKEPYKWQTGILLFFLSMAAVSLTLWGAGTILVIVTIPVILSLFRKERNYKHLLYIPWSTVVPIIAVVFYTVYRFSV